MEYYDFPERKVDIFEPHDKNYFIKSNKFTYLCTYEEVAGIDMWNDFWGEFVLVVYKRYALIALGRVIYQNEGFEDGHPAKGRYKENGFVIISNIPRKYYIKSWRDYFVSYEIRNDQEGNSAINPTIYQTATDAVNAALEMSKSKLQRYMVAQWFDECDRH